MSVARTVAMGNDHVAFAMEFQLKAALEEKGDAANDPAHANFLAGALFSGRSAGRLSAGTPCSI